MHYDKYPNCQTCHPTQRQLPESAFDHPAQKEPILLLEESPVEESSGLQANLAQIFLAEAVNRNSS